MIVLGIEGTAHTLGIGILEDYKIKANVIKMYRPEKGGIQPRDAAIHHYENFIPALKEALKISNISIKDIDLVAFSKGPGLGPCLRTVATAARAISLKLNIPIIGVNHSIAHLEIGKFTTKAEDPVMTYLSGGNTQIISFSNGRYRVFGETLDIGIGNMLDKFAREAGIPFPGGPKIEILAKSGEKYLSLPYTVKGMDVAFSGILTASLSYLKRGERIEDISYSIQENVFSMMAEVTERALTHLKKDEILLAGGVARNKRLQEIFKILAEERNINLFVPPPDLCVDNGAMIAYLGKIMYESGIRMDISDTEVDQKFRADSIDAVWVKEKRHYKNYEDMPGAEARIQYSEFLGLKSVRKIRLERKYRIKEIDERLRKERIKREAKLIHEAKKYYEYVPHIFDIDLDNGILEMEFIDGKNLREIYKDLDDGEREKIAKNIGIMLSKLHSGKISHGDMTTSNIIYKNNNLYLIDFSMGNLNAEIEELSEDLHLLKESMKSSHPEYFKNFDLIIEEYKKNFKDSYAVLENLKKIEMRRRYS
ncbi:MAG: bifunctional N(6)-L-threonylcarbamoyladenine synthase/serine/threonine protein kinase [Thermoplasmata archaeon]